MSWKSRANLCSSKVSDGSGSLAAHSFEGWVGEPHIEECRQFAPVQPREAHGEQIGLKRDVRRGGEWRACRVIAAVKDDGASGWVAGEPARFSERIFQVSNFVNQCMSVSLGG